MAKIHDYRKLGIKYDRFYNRFNTDMVESVDTNNEGDYIVSTRDGNFHCFRSSCALTFRTVGGKVQMIIR